MVLLWAQFMNKNERSSEQPSELGRRDFLKTTSFATLMAWMGGVELRADTNTAPATAKGLTVAPPPPPINVGVIGCNLRGRELTRELKKLKYPKVVAFCDTYKAAMRRASEDFPSADKLDDYKQLLARKDVQAVVVATPTHLHKDIVIDALAAGKHVYCEAPLANTIDDAKAIATAAKNAPKQLFQAGLQLRAHPQRAFLGPFMRGGAVGRNALVRAQWHKKDSWRAPAPTDTRAKAINWRLDRAVSTGLMGEIGIHQIDAVTWFLGERPTAVTGFNSLVLWNDGRTVPDTVQAVFEYPFKSQAEGMNDSVHFIYDATLCNSFDSEYEVYYGSDSAVMIRDFKAWKFPEPDAPLVGWEVYARKDLFYTEQGVALVADATKQTAIGKGAASSSAYEESPAYYSLAAFTENADTFSDSVKTFTDTYGDDPDELKKYLATLKLKPYAGWKEGLEATVLAIKANEAVVNNQKIVLQKEWFEL
jgi:predicted dehydrogenase